MKILDCTLRDGGHTNNWSFDIQFAKDLYDVATSTGVDYFEIGYRNSKLRNKSGIFAYSFDDFLLENFYPKKNCKIAVMAQHGKFTVSDFIEKDVSKTLISTIRVATYLDTLDSAVEECKILKDKGYEVFLNLMAISCYKDDDFKKLINIQQKCVLDCVVLSDSFGALLPEDVSTIIKKMTNLGFTNLGFHSHNNLQLAFANTLSAINSGCSVIDATICGIGRGVGNLSIEQLLSYLYINNKMYHPFDYFSLIEKYYPHKVESVLFLISGLFNIHPQYLAELAQNKSLSLKDIYLKAIEISKLNPISFNKNLL